MWLTRNSWLYAKWDFTWSIDHTWSALRLTQVTGTIAQAGGSICHQIRQHYLPGLECG